MIVSQRVALCVCCLLCLCGNCVHGDYVMPNVTLLSCLYRIAAFRIDNATAGGLVYTRTDVVSNIIPSEDGTMMYNCGFDDCQINWDERFYVVIQRRILYQSSYDQIQWFACSTDLGSIIPFNVDFAEMDEEELIIIERKPAGMMRIFSHGLELSSGSTVKLGTQLNMMLQLSNNDDGLLDITPRTCWASTINLITEQCPMDTDLFGYFTTVSNGNLSNIFYMFRPTNAMGGPQEVQFLCTLKVCLDTCEQKVCSNETDDSDPSSNGTRRKRDVQPSGGSSRGPTIVLGAKLRAIAEGEEVYVDDIQIDEFCVSMDALFIVTMVFVLLYMASLGTTGYTFYRFHLTKQANNASEDPADDGACTSPPASPALSAKSFTDDEKETPSLDENEPSGTGVNETEPPRASLDETEYEHDIEFDQSVTEPASCYNTIRRNSSDVKYKQSVLYSSVSQRPHVYGSTTSMSYLSQHMAVDGLEVANLEQETPSARRKSAAAIKWCGMTNVQLEQPPSRRRKSAATIKWSRDKQTNRE